MITYTPTHFAFARQITLDANATTAWAQILVTGQWKHPKYGDMAITPELLNELKANFNAGARDLVVADYDHGTRRPDGSGNAILSGQVKALELRNNDTELWAEFEPTEPAREKIAKKEYVRTSADFETGYTDKRTGKSWGAVLCGFALTNRPYIEGMQPLALSDAHGDARLFADFNPPTRKSSMKTAEKLGLPADATDEQMGAAVDKLKSDASAARTLSESHAASSGVVGEIRTALNLAENAPAKDIISTVKSLSEKTATLEKAKRESEADALLNTAVSEGRFPPASKPKFREQLLSDNAAVAAGAKDLIASLPAGTIPLGERKASGADGAPAGEAREKLLDETIAKIQKENPELSYKDAAIQALDQLPPDTAAAGGEK